MAASRWGGVAQTSAINRPPAESEFDGPLES